MACLFHKYLAVDEKEHTHCGGCFKAYGHGRCPHSIRVCSKCGRFKGCGSHGRLSVVPDSCKRQVEHMKPKLFKQDFGGDV